MSLGKRLKQLRLAQGKTQQEVADSLGIAKSTYSLYESDKREPNVLSLKKLAKIFDTTGDYLLELHDFADEDSERLHLLIAMERLNADGKERLLRYANDLIASGNYENSSSSLEERARQIRDKTIANMRAQKVD